ncbi:MAG: FAD-dependent oxidoreductase [Acidimicrobiia bacterium]|nr:FAD-dependent oxidoreductase [Acidimicrobiia bacterium]
MGEIRRSPRGGVSHRGARSRTVTDVVVLGAGPAGLYSGLLLAHRGFEVSIIESGETPGGLASGLEIAGQRVDRGSHRLHPSIDDDILDDLSSLLGDDLQVRHRNGRIRLGGSWLRFPLSPTDLVTNLAVSTTARLARGALAALTRRPDDTTYESVVTTGLGRPMGDLFYFPYARKIWGAEPDELSGTQARRRIAADSPLKLLRKATSRSGGRSFLYPRRGFGQITDALADAVVDEGATLRLGSPVVGLKPDDEGWVVRLGNGQNTKAPLVLSTIPLAVLARLLDPPDEVAAALDGLESRAMILAYLVVPRERWTPYDAHYFPEEDLVFTRISESKNYRDSDEDPPAQTVLCVEIPVGPEHPLWVGDNQEILQRVRNDVVTTGLPDPGHFGVVHKLRNVYPIYRVGTEQNLKTVDRWVGQFSNLLTFGRQGLFAHDNTHHTLAMGRDAVASVTSSGRIDDGVWAQSRRSFATHVVED